MTDPRSLPPSRRWWPPASDALTDYELVGAYVHAYAQALGDEDGEFVRVIKPGRYARRARKFVADHLRGDRTEWRRWCVDCTGWIADRYLAGLWPGRLPAFADVVSVPMLKRWGGEIKRGGAGGPYTL